MNITILFILITIAAGILYHFAFMAGRKHEGDIFLDQARAYLDDNVKNSPFVTINGNKHSAKFRAVTFDGEDL